MDTKKRKNRIQNLRERKTRIKVKSASSRLRLSVSKSNKYISAQIIDDKTQKTLVSVSSRELKEKGAKTELAEKVGRAIAEKAKKEKIKEVKFDRGKYAYHGRVKALAEGARKGGLEF